ELSPQDAIDGLPHAPVGRRKRRFIPSRNFWNVGITIPTLAAESKNTNSDKDAPEKDGGEGKKGKEQEAKLDKEVKRLFEKGLTLGEVAKELGVDMETVKASALAEMLSEKRDFDIVVLDDNYNDVLGRLEALGFRLMDTGEGESHRLRYPRGRDAPRVDPDELGEVVQVINFD
ncbi:unnamed protein product, partial [marine sediment metagenome]